MLSSVSFYRIYCQVDYIQNLTRMDSSPSPRTWRLIRSYARKPMLIWRLIENLAFTLRGMQHELPHVEMMESMRELNINRHSYMGCLKLIQNLENEGYFSISFDS